MKSLEIIKELEAMGSEVNMVTYQVRGCDSITLPINKIDEMLVDIEEEFGLKQGSLEVSQALSSEYLEFVEFHQTFKLI